MLRFEENDIYLTRGDTAYIGLNLTGFDGTLEDTLTMSVKKSVSDIDYTFQIIVPFGSDIKILPEHTRELEYGKYFYDIQLDMANGDVFTIVAPSKFVVTEEVTV